MADVFLALSSAGDEGSIRPVSPPCPTQLPPCHPLTDAPVLAGRSRGQAVVRNPPVLSGSAHQASRLPQDGAEQVRGGKHTRDLCADDSPLYLRAVTPAFRRSCSQPLLSPTPTDLSAVSTVHEWLRALRMERYQEEFDQAHLDTLDRVSMLTME